MERVNRLTIISESVKRNKEWYVYAKCECGSVKEYRQRYITTGHTKSCGCYCKTHGLARTPIFKVWQSMKERCYNSNHSAFKGYGDRGITICDEWLKDVAVFAKWALENGWRQGLQIDRINNDLGYSPSNCRVVTAKINMRNKRGIKTLTYNGETRPLVEWAEKFSLSIFTLRNRIDRGWEIHRALTRPIDKSKNRYI